ncbi:uncharacterized protein LOC133777757 [Humulus lupulus]|uniref:uncharacterized protein LOC133777757 n=1 Tax=Humulus lupulus TaxID=3486 RepID=UPI002B405E6D|nr:uncharacterized protein LOC133777757 [Humulus lupulus]
MSNTIQHFSHRHLLKQLDVMQYVYEDLKINCELCQLVIDHSQICYRCIQWCRYFLHKKCAELPQYVDHALHPDHSPLMLQRTSSSHDTVTCYYCENSFQTQETLAYICNHCSLHMHITCALIPIPTLIGSNDNNAQYFCHQHPMPLVKHDDSKAQAKCFACQSHWTGSAYSCLSCHNFLHHSCTNSQLKIDQHPFHSHHPLTLQFSKPRSCNLCCKKDCRLIFRCHNECDFNLCTECVVPKTAVRCQSHDHLLYFVEKSFYEGSCHACKKSYTHWTDHPIPDEVNRTKSFLFRCIECDFNFHFLCGPLPFTVSFKYHIHPLILVEDYPAEDDDCGDEYYCDICEEERNPYFRIYYCKECKYAAHIHCLLLEIMKVINGNMKGVKVMALGESRWSQFISEEEILLGGINEGTLNDLIHSLTDEDNNMLNHRLSFDIDLDEKYSLEEYYKFLHRENSPLFDHDLLSIEDIYKIHRVSRFDEAEFENFWRELIFNNALNNLKFDDKYLRQKVVDVEGYKVPITLVPILKTLLHKYEESDLFGSRVLSSTPARKSVFATLFCIVCDGMCKTKIEDVTKDDIKDWYFYLSTIKGVTSFDLDADLQKFRKRIMRPFLCFEAIRYEKDISQKLESRIEELEAELDKCKKKHQWFKEQMAESLDEIKGSLTRALGSKGKKVDEIISFDELLD